MMRCSWLLLAPIALLSGLTGCSGGEESTGNALRDGVRIEREFLEAIVGEWSGTLAETPALEKRVMRETPMLLRVEEGDAPVVAYPDHGCLARLAVLQDASPPSTATTLRLFQNVEMVKPGTPCLPGPVRLVRSSDGETLEYSYLGDPLRRVEASLRRTDTSE